MRPLGPGAKRPKLVRMPGGVYLQRNTRRYERIHQGRAVGEIPILSDRHAAAGVLSVEQPAHDPARLAVVDVIIAGVVG